MTEQKSMNFTSNSLEYPDPLSNFFTFEKKKKKTVPGYNTRINRRRPGSYWQRFTVISYEKLFLNENSKIFHVYKKSIMNFKNNLKVINSHSKLVK